MRQVAQRRIVNTARFLNDGNCGILQAIPIGADRVFIAGVKEFKELEYSLEGPVPFSGDPRLAFNSMLEEVSTNSPEGFKLIGKEFNRIARLSGTNDPVIVNTFRTRLDNHGELLTFLAPGYRKAGRVVSLHSLDNLAQSGDIPEGVCLAIIEVRCERNFDYIPSRGAYFFFYYPEKIKVVSHIVHGGPPLDCPGEEWEAKAYEGSLESDIYKFFEHNDGAISIELQTQPRGLLHAVLGEFSLERGSFSQTGLRYSPAMVRNSEARYAFSPPEIPKKGNTNHLNEFKKCLEILHETTSRAVSRQSDIGG